MYGFKTVFNNIQYQTYIKINQHTSNFLITCICALFYSFKCFYFYVCVCVSFFVNLQW